MTEELSAFYCISLLVIKNIWILVIGCLRCAWQSKQTALTTGLCHGSIVDFPATTTTKTCIFCIRFDECWKPALAQTDAGFSTEDSVQIPRDLCGIRGGWNGPGIHFYPKFSDFFLSIGIQPALLTLSDDLDNAARCNVLGLKVTNFISGCALNYVMSGQSKSNVISGTKVETV